MVHIEQIAYEAERLEFFSQKMIRAQQRYNRLFNALPASEPYLSEKRQEVDDAARISHFYHDVVEMLEQKLKES